MFSCWFAHGCFSLSCSSSPKISGVSTFLITGASNDNVGSLYGNLNVAIPMNFEPLCAETTLWPFKSLLQLVSRWTFDKLVTGLRYREILLDRYQSWYLRTFPMDIVAGISCFLMNSRTSVCLDVWVFRRMNAVLSSSYIRRIPCVHCFFCFLETL